MQRRRRPAVEAADVRSSGCGRAAAARPARGGRSGRRAGGPRGRGGRRLPGSRSITSGKWQSRIRRSASRPPAARAARGGGGTCAGRRRRSGRGVPRSSIVRESSVSSVAGSRSATAGGMREGVAGRGEVVVAEHGEAARQAGEQRPQPCLAGAAREQVAADQRQVGLPLLDPVDRALDRRRAARGHAEVEVREVRDPQALELGRQARQRARQRLELDPARLEVSPRQPGRRRGAAEPDELSTRPRASRRPARPRRRGA